MAQQTTFFTAAEAKEASLQLGIWPWAFGNPVGYVPWRGCKGMLGVPWGNGPTTGPTHSWLMDMSYPPVN